ncbi:TonB-dependent receptor [Litorimonas cladophorae]|uniref:TonB-dependent receptor n=1 Tax=Litorimonas cladophorae TaxID=1220491 RepID=A0A918NJ86_9PROT|nr:TonB-dependent receptor [Litorimonas cladophorae]GGX71760.1 TonB-dependent receptor [Litorimonas cladophorae]
MNKIASAGLALLSTTALMSASTAFAQSSDTSFREDVVISTATRRPEALQDVPIAVTVLSPEVLEKQGVVNVQDLAIVAPSFASSAAQTASGTVVLRIRGVGTTSNNIGFESAVGVFIDGAYQSRPGIALGEFVDVENVEVLRGPQGTLFGRNTSAGALKIVNNRPDLTSNEVSGFVNATLGNYAQKSVQGAINIPVVEDKVAVRLTGAYRNRNGYLKLFDANGNRIGESNAVDQFMLRGQVGWEADNGFKGRLIVDHSESSAPVGAALEVQQSAVETAGLFGAVGLGARGGMVGPDVAIGVNDDSGAQAAVDNLISGVSFEPNPSSDQTGFVLEMEYPISDNADLIYLGSIRDYDAFEDYDSDFSGIDVLNVSGPLAINTMSHELRVQGSAMEDRLSWMVGAYYSDEEIEQDVRFELGEDYGELVGALFFAPTGGAFGANPLSVLTGGIDPAGTTMTQNYAQDSTSFSLFTHNIFDVTDQLSLTLGLRYSDETKDGSFGQSNAANTICPATLGSIGAGNVPAPLVSNVFGLGCLAFLAPADLPQAAVFPLPRTFDETFKDEELIYTAKLGYEIAPSVSTYASFTHGYKAGGFNLDSTAASGGAEPSFLSEEVDAYEIGLKSKLLDNMLTLNVAAFIQNFDNFQVLEFTGAQFTTFNVPKANSKGIEIEAVARPTDGLTLNGALTLVDAAYPDDCAGSDTRINVTSLCGNDLTNAPGTVGILGANYEGSLTENLNFFLNAQMRYESDRRTSTQAVVLATQAPNPYDVQDANTKVNARIGLTDADDSYAFELWATNLTNEITRGVTFNTVFRSGSRSAFIQEPRMFGATVRKNF